jgi:hypothetical protein
MYGRDELVELGERIAEDGVHRHERALQELALVVETRSPGAAAALSDRSAPSVLRERAFAVAADVVLYRSPASEEPSESDHIGDELARVLLDWQGQLVAWGA